MLPILARVDLGVIAMKEYSQPPTSKEIKAQMRLAHGLIYIRGIPFKSERKKERNEK